MRVILLAVIFISLNAVAMGPQKDHSIPVTHPVPLIIDPNLAEAPGPATQQLLNQEAQADRDELAALRSKTTVALVARWQQLAQSSVAGEIEKTLIRYFPLDNSYLRATAPMQNGLICTAVMNLDQTDFNESSVKCAPSKSELFD